ncbi:MAG: hypothetical protein AAFX78_08955 [Cyanobacteria bacterium J06638_20]
MFHRLFSYLAPGLALGLVGSVFAPPAQAQAVIQGGASIFEDVRLSPSFSPVIVRGISGGATSATRLTNRSETDTGPCLGFVDSQPDHRMELTSAFDFLSLQVQSTEDTTLVVRGPGGVWCNDNYSLDFNPGMAGEWLPGLYEIWVGSHRVNRYYPYIIEISETPDAQTESSQFSLP